MRSRRLLLLAALLCQAALNAHAEGSGLRLKEYTEGITLPTMENGLKLRFVPAPTEATSPIPSAEQSAGFADAAPPRNRSMFRADWPVGAGLHTSLGLDWSASAGQTGSGNRTLDPMPLFGLGWESASGTPSRWKLSAEIGTAFVSGQPCNALIGCPANRAAAGLNPYGYGSGLRLNPYVNFGATFSFGQ